MPARAPLLPHLFFYLTTRLLVPGVFAQLIALGCVVERLRGRAPSLWSP